MAMIDNASRAPFGAITIYRVTLALTEVVERFGAWQAKRRSAAALSRLSPALLEDIGLSAASVASRTPTTIQRVSGWVSAEIARTRTLSELHRLSPAMRADIGVSEMDIERYKIGGSLR